MNFQKLKGVFIAVIFYLCACVEPFDPPVNDADVNYLVVDGLLNASEDLATVILSRTLPVKNAEETPAESSATVRLEDENGIFYPLSETEAGFYSGSVPNASSETRYRLVIHTNDNQEYVSDFIVIMETPVIDSISYTGSDDGVEFAVNTHDPSGTSRHFRWKYEETYEYNSNFNSLFTFSGDQVIWRPLDQSIFTCWRTVRSTDILVGSTKHLQQSVVSQFPLTFIPKESEKISVKYSLLVQQQALTQEAYDYWLNLEKSTEHLGGLFDPLPSEVSGNIHCITNPTKAVIGFFSGSTLQKVRIFVDRRELPEPLSDYFINNPYCDLHPVYLPELPALNRDFLFLVDAIYARGVGIIGYTTSTKGCVDCRSRGGVTSRPSFWE